MTMIICECMTWCRLGGPHTTHHPNCEHYNDSLIDVWKVEYDGAHYFSDYEPEKDELSGEETVTKQKMHREIFERLPEFQGF